MKSDELYNLENPTPEQKRHLELLEETRRKYPNRPNLAVLNAKRLLHKTPLDSENFDEQIFWRDLAEIMKNPLPAEKKTIRLD